MAKISYHQFIIYTWYRNKYFSEQEICNYLCVQHFTHENRVLAVALPFHYVSCFNAILSRYHIVNLFCIALYKVLCRPTVSIKIQVGRTVLHLKKTFQITRNLIKKGPKFTDLAIPQPKFFFVVQPWWLTFLTTLSHLPKNFWLCPCRGNL